MFHDYAGQAMKFADAPYLSSKPPSKITASHRPKLKAINGNQILALVITDDTESYFKRYVASIIGLSFGLWFKIYSVFMYQVMNVNFVSKQHAENADISGKYLANPTPFKLRDNETAVEILYKWCKCFIPLKKLPSRKMLSLNLHKSDKLLPT
jgi:hypothetical protein